MEWFREVFGHDEKGESTNLSWSFDDLRGMLTRKGREAEEGKEGRAMKSVNGSVSKEFFAGAFSTPSVGSLWHVSCDVAERLKQPRGGKGGVVEEEGHSCEGGVSKPHRGLTFTSIAADVRVLQRRDDAKGAVFQAASQFNCLEMVGPSVTPESGITQYVWDKTQGPACALACPAGTYYRNYLVPLTVKGVAVMGRGEKVANSAPSPPHSPLESLAAFDSHLSVHHRGQCGGSDRQINLLADSEVLLQRWAVDASIKQKEKGGGKGESRQSLFPFWTMKNGYLIPTSTTSMASLAEMMLSLDGGWEGTVAQSSTVAGDGDNVAAVEKSAVSPTLSSLRRQIIDSIRVGVQWDTEVYRRGDTTIVINSTENEKGNQRLKPNLSAADATAQPFQASRFLCSPSSSPSPSSPRHTIAQVYTSAVPVAYCKSTRSADWAYWARCCLSAAYEGTLGAAMVRLGEEAFSHPSALLPSSAPAPLRSHRKTVYLTAVGGGAFGNRDDWINDAMLQSLVRYKDMPLDVVLVHYGGTVPASGLAFEKRVRNALRSRMRP